MQNKQAFTFIELLVVVLIVGILVAVALPQYQVAVRKAKLANLFPIVKAIDNAQRAFLLANGHYAGSFDELDIQLPSGGSVSDEARNEKVTPGVVYKDFKCFMYMPDKQYAASLYCGLMRGEDKLIMLEKYFSKGYTICWGYDDIGDRICRGLTQSDTKFTTDGIFGYKIDL